MPISTEILLKRQRTEPKPEEVDYMVEFLKTVVRMKKPKIFSHSLVLVGIVLQSTNPPNILVEPINKA